MQDAGYRGRFAPSPTGPLHLGSLVAALGSWLDARHHGGRWLLRIEDIDPPREIPGAAAAQLRTLEAMGLVADEPPLWQSSRREAYESAIAQLLAAGLAFECRCSRSDLAPVGGIHRACVKRPSGRQPAIRVRMPPGRTGFVDRLRGPHSQDLPQEVGDVVLRRADGLHAYQLAVVIDDAWQGVSDIVRGADLISSTPRQIALQRLLGLATPRYLHLPLVLDAAGGKLSKSLAALPISDDDPLTALAAAWRFLLPASPAPRAGSVEAWLQRAMANYRPTDLRAADHPAPGLEQGLR